MSVALGEFLIAITDLYPRGHARLSVRDSAKSGRQVVSLLSSKK